MWSRTSYAIDARFATVAFDWIMWLMRVRVAKLLPKKKKMTVNVRGAAIAVSETVCHYVQLQ